MPYIVIIGSAPSLLPASRPLMRMDEARAYPAGNDVERGRGEGLLDIGIFAGCAGPRGLEQMVEPGKLAHRHVAMAGQSGADPDEIVMRHHLLVEAAVEREHRDVDRGQSRRR